MRQFRSTVSAILIACMGVGFLSLASNHYAACGQRQRQYDGEITLVRFLAKEIGATTAQTDKAVADLRQTLGARPSC